MDEKTVEIKELFDSLYLREKNMTAGQLSFIRSCKKYFAKNKTLSEKQLSALISIKRGVYTEDRYSMS